MVMTSGGRWTDGERLLTCGRWARGLCPSVMLWSGVLACRRCLMDLESVDDLISRVNLPGGESRLREGCAAVSPVAICFSLPRGAAGTQLPTLSSLVRGRLWLLALLPLLL